MTALIEVEGAKMVEVSAAGPSSYASSTGISMTVTEARGVLAIVNAHNTAGYGMGNFSYNASSNTVTFHAFVSGGTEVTDGTDLSGVTFTLLVLAK